MREDARARAPLGGYFEGGHVGVDTFDVDYRFNNRKNPQVYAEAIPR